MSHQWPSPTTKRGYEEFSDVEMEEVHVHMAINHGNMPIPSINSQHKLTAFPSWFQLSFWDAAVARITPTCFPRLRTKHTREISRMSRGI